MCNPTSFAADNRLVHRLQWSVCLRSVHAAVQFAIPSVRGFVGHMFSPKLPLPFWGSSPHITLFLGPSPLIIPNGISIGSTVFVWVINAALYNALSVWMNCLCFPLGFRHPAGGAPATAISNIYNNWQRSRVWFRIYHRRQTHTHRHADYNTPQPLRRAQ